MKSAAEDYPRFMATAAAFDRLTAGRNCRDLRIEAEGTGHDTSRRGGHS